MPHRQLRIPFDADGNMLAYPESWKTMEWRENADFYDEMAFKGFERGRSSAVAIFMNLDRKLFPMFLKDLANAMPFMDNAKLNGVFRYQKRGTNYGVKLVNPKDKDIHVPDVAVSAEIKTR